MTESKHEELFKTASDAINNVFSDTSVSKEETERSLTGLLEDCEMLLESLHD